MYCNLRCKTFVVTSMAHAENELKRQLDSIRQQMSVLRIREEELMRRNAIHVPEGRYSCHICRTSLSIPFGYRAYPPEPIECPICRESSNPIMMLSCGHFICCDCFNGFFVLRQSRTRRQIRIGPPVLEGNLVENAEDTENRIITTFISTAISLIFFDPLSETVSIRFIDTPDTTYIYHILDMERWREITSTMTHQNSSIGEIINQCIRDANLLSLISRTSVYQTIDDLDILGITVYDLRTNTDDFEYEQHFENEGNIERVSQFDEIIERFDENRAEQQDNDAGIDAGTSEGIDAGKEQEDHQPNTRVYNLRNRRVEFSL